MKKTICIMLALLLVIISAVSVSAAPQRSKADLDRVLREGRTTKIKVNGVESLEPIPYRIIPEGVTDMTPPVILEYTYPEGYESTDRSMGINLADRSQGIMPKRLGNYVTPRINTWTSSSQGFYRQGYKEGTFSSIAAIILPFIKGGSAGAAISTILSLVGLAAGASNFVSGETLISYTYYYRDGEGKWDTLPYWYLGYRTGRRETRRHAYGGVENSQKVMVLKAYNYPGVYDTYDTPNYKCKDSYLLNAALVYVTAGASPVIETNW